MDSGFSPLMDHVAQAQGRPWTQDTGSRVGCPIRKSLDQSSFAAPQGLSQRTTSFIASQRQGIHQMLLRHLIALMIDVRCERQPYGCPLTRPRSQKDQRQDPLGPRRCMLAERIRPAALAHGPDTFPLHDVKHPRRGMTPPGTNLVFPRAGLAAARRHSRQESGGAGRDRTDDLMLAKHALSHLSYSPKAMPAG